MVKAGRLRSKRVLAIHTGGLQGISATESRLGVKIFS
jgi:1-aminocyclopropane-1-carboxylate deaminase/D-cysteine desulfhydrase-like pyridoxal-dependent ACC family enzyme